MVEENIVSVTLDHSYTGLTIGGNYSLKTMGGAREFANGTVANNLITSEETKYADWNPKLKDSSRHLLECSGLANKCGRSLFAGYPFALAW